MRVAIIGGTGFVGSYIIDALIDAGHAVSMLVRPGSMNRIHRSDIQNIVEGDVECPASLDSTLIDCDAVIYCIGILREQPRKGVTFSALQYESLVRTVEVALNQGVGRFLLMSANGVKIPGTPYQETKKRAEEVVLASGLDATVFRPSVIFGDPRGKMEIATQLFCQMVRPPIPAVSFFSGLRPGEGQFMMSPVHVEDVARAFVEALENRSTYGRTYALGGPESLTWTEMIRRIASATGRRKWVLPCPIGLMRIAATIFDWLPFFPTTRDQLQMLAEGNVADSRVIRSLTDRAPKAFDEKSLAYLAEERNE